MLILYSQLHLLDFVSCNQICLVYHIPLRKVISIWNIFCSGKGKIWLLATACSITSDISHKKFKSTCETNLFSVIQTGNSYTVFPRHRWEGNIKLGLKVGQILCECKLDSIGSGQHPLVSSCKHWKEPSDTIKHVKFLEQMNGY